MSDNLIKYTIMPKNDKEDYEHNFNLSLTEFAKSLEGKVFISPLIIYNSELDVPMDIEECIDEFIIFADKEDILTTLQKESLHNDFRTLILHGYDISLDEVREIYCPLARKSNANICINVIQDIDIDSNLTFYLYSDLDTFDDDEWEETKTALFDEMHEYIEEYKQFGTNKTSDLEKEFMNLLLSLSDEDLNDLEESLDNIIADAEKKEKTKSKDNVTLLPTTTIKKPEENKLYRDVITCSYEYKDYISLNKLENDLYTIQDDEFEILLTTDQIEFLFDSYLRIKDKDID